MNVFNLDENLKKFFSTTQRRTANGWHGAHSLKWFLIACVGVVSYLLLPNPSEWMERTGESFAYYEMHMFMSVVVDLFLAYMFLNFIIGAIIGNLRVHHEKKLKERRWAEEREADRKRGQQSTRRGFGGSKEIV